MDDNISLESILGTELGCSMQTITYIHREVKCPVFQTDSRKDISLAKTYHLTVLQYEVDRLELHISLLPLFYLSGNRWFENNVCAKPISDQHKLIHSFCEREELLSVCTHTHTSFKTVVEDADPLCIGTVFDTINFHSIYLRIKKEHCSSDLVSPLDTAHFYSD